MAAQGGRPPLEPRGCKQGLCVTHKPCAGTYLLRHLDSHHPPRPVLNRLSDVRRLDILTSRQIGDGAR
jgi:hypothetical protein